MFMFLLFSLDLSFTYERKHVRFVVLSQVYFS
jgi:predicted neuraminidase